MMSRVNPLQPPAWCFWALLQQVGAETFWLPLAAGVRREDLAWLWPEYKENGSIVFPFWDGPDHHLASRCIVSLQVE
jgi:hypothetical protein